MSANLTADDVNFLVFRYLQESGAWTCVLEQPSRPTLTSALYFYILVTLPRPAGFQHTAFTFGFESHVQKTNANDSDVPPGALISFVQKGLQYLELEANLNQARPVRAVSAAACDASTERDARAGGNRRRCRL